MTARTKRSWSSKASPQKCIDWACASISPTQKHLHRHLASSGMTILEPRRLGCSTLVLASSAPRLRGKSCLRSPLLCFGVFCDHPCFSERACNFPAKFSSCTIMGIIRESEFTCTVDLEKDLALSTHVHVYVCICADGYVCLHVYVYVDDHVYEHIYAC